MADNAILALVFRMVLVALVTADAEIYALFHPVLFFLFAVFGVKLRANINLNCVVSCGQRLDIPLEVVVLLATLHIVEVVDYEESEEDG